MVVVVEPLGAPFETMMVTVDPFLATTPATGVCEMTVPLGTVELFACLVLTLNPAFFNIDDADELLSPVTSGTTACGAAVVEVVLLLVVVDDEDVVVDGAVCGPLETTMVTSEPLGA